MCFIGFLNLYAYFNTLILILIDIHSGTLSVTQDFGAPKYIFC